MRMIWERCTAYRHTDINCYIKGRTYGWVSQQGEDPPVFRAWIVEHDEYVKNFESVRAAMRYVRTIVRALYLGGHYEE